MEPRLAKKTILIKRRRTNVVTQQEKSVSAFFIFNKNPSNDLEAALSSLHESDKWSLMRIQVDKSVSVAFRVTKVPALVVYGQATEETARAVGEINIIDLIAKVGME